MSYGFKVHDHFQVIGAADAQMGKPSSAIGSLACNQTYATNINLTPQEVDLADVNPRFIRESWGIQPGQLDVLCACPPCTGFSRTTASNHTYDDPRNSLVGRVSDFVDELKPRIILMENARELAMGRQRHHLNALIADLHAAGYETHAATHFLNNFGLPQIRERALVVAVRKPLQIKTLEDLWRNYCVVPKALTVRNAISHLPWLEAGEQDDNDPAHTAPSFRSELTFRRMKAIPQDGGSWADLVGNPTTEKLLNPAHRRIINLGKVGSHPDVYGRMWWDEPARTIKRECAHVGNGRYSHPQQDRLCSLREMATLQGFPQGYRFQEQSLANAYRHVGDAVPPLISYQLAWLAAWILGEKRPDAENLALEGTSLRPSDILYCDSEDTQ
ncbi:DNA (cytosine-5)-methyltransferase 1 [Actinopolyspora mzabensis]|uniref:DNA (cytosine-5-)-methyltransferase n=2 Tax=Actinopolyspora mzabensis TaxID=995066 RepID=A0A1G8XE80_ACTMZ|nr:DNA (cytosine-5)-methyltransferase 1 [Actinopolyspora mzabensis]